MSTTSNKILVREFIRQVWNERKLELIDHFIHADYHDHSFIPAIPTNKEGLLQWVAAISASFDHQTVIASMVAEDDMVAAHILFKVKQVGKWRNIEPSGKEAEVKGFRHFRVKDGKIAEHWALLDGEALQTALTNTVHGCAVTQ
jgi:predicted SnoaL-like aldol condensation-catalyzing enzyme